MLDKNDLRLRYKGDLLKKDWEISFNMYTKHILQITSVRGWTITLLIAYLGFLASFNKFDVIFIGPMVLIILGFFILELFEATSLTFISNKVQEVEQLFMLDDPDKFIVGIENYLFRNFEYQTYTKKFLSIMYYTFKIRVIF